MNITNVLYSTHTAPSYIPPLLISERQIIIGPNYPDASAGGRVKSIRVAPGRYDLGALIPSLPKDQKPDLTVVLIDSFQHCVPENLAAVPGRKLLLVADTHHGETPLQKCLAYARQQPFDRIALIHDPHHLHWFAEAKIVPTTYIPNANVAYFPQSFNEHRQPQIVFVGQAGQFHLRRSRLLQIVQNAGLPLIVQQTSASSAAAMYASTQITFNCSLNGDLNMRVFEAIAAGGFLITDRLSPQSGLENLFQRDEHYVDYENEHDLLAKLRHYLARPYECLKIARAGQQVYLKNHRPAQRVRDLLAFAFGAEGVSPARDQRALAKNDGFGHNLDDRVRLYEICQNISLRKERALVVVDAALGGRVIADLVDLPRLKICVATDATPSSAVRDSLNQLGTLDQIEFIEGEAGACDVMVMDARTMASWRNVRDVRAQMVLVMATGTVTDSQAQSLAANRLWRLGEKLWVFQNQGDRSAKPQLEASPSGSSEQAPAFDQALVFYQAGRLSEAEQMYRQVLKDQPNHFNALHLLGVIHHQRGNHEEAVRHIDAALKINPKIAAAYRTRGFALQKLKRFDEAVASFDQSISLAPDDASTFYNRGNALQELKRFGAAATSYDQAIALKPDYAGAFYNRGNALQKLGRTDEALASYNQAIALKHDHADTFNNRGVVLQKLKRFDEAVASYDRAIALAADNASAFYNRGAALQELKRFDEAVASYDRVIALTPNYPGAYFNRGNALHALKRFDEALTSYNEAITLKRDYAEALNNRGVTLKELKRIGEALLNWDKAIALKPDYVDAFNNRGTALQELKRFDEALVSYNQAIALKPDHAGAFNNRGTALQELKRFDEALVSYNQAIVLKPDHADAFNNRGNALQELKRFDEALVSYNQAIALKPDYADAFNNRGNALLGLKRVDEAFVSYNQAIALKADYADAFSNRGNALQELGRTDEALASYNQAIVLKPDHADAFNNRGDMFWKLRCFDEARASYTQAIALMPGHKFAFSGLAGCTIQVCDWTQRDRLSGEVRQHVIERKSQIWPFLLLGYNDDAAMHLACAQNYVLDRFNGVPQRLGSRAIWRHDKIRVAYLSGDFRRHATAYLASELFERHDRSRFEVIGVSFGPDDGSDMRSRLAAAFDQFIDVRLQSDQDVARLINDLQVDIAVDLNGHTQYGRLGILAFRPAPIQVTYLGFPGTTGTDFIDYIIGDAIVLPFDQQPYSTERIVHLPDCYQVNDEKRTIAPRTPTRGELGLPAEGFVFCCFNNTWKITPAVFDVWMRLLNTIEGSVLWLFRDNGNAETNLRKEAAVRGIDPTRLIFADRLPLQDHLARHRLADLFLDTLPCNAHTTASDALWSELPVLTWRGKTFAGRVAASLLNAVGLPELVTDNLEEYEGLALRLATDWSLRTAFRERLQKNRLQCPLFDTDRFRRHIESAYATMWELWQRGEKPRSFKVEAVT
jgi:protein O-GlcNAc transferase